MNDRHSCGIYLMFIVAIRPSNFLEAPISPYVVPKCSNLFAVSKILSLAHVIQKIPLL
jgi:hypothetical protein